MDNSDIIQDGDDNRQNVNQGIPGQIQTFLISQRDKEKITGNRYELVENMIVSPGFLALLRQEKVIDASGEEEIRVHPLSADKAAAVLRYIEKGPVYAFKALIKALIVTNQEHLSDMLDKSLTDELKREMPEPKSHKSRPRQTHQDTGDHGKPSSVSPIDEIDLTQKDSIMKVEITPIDKDDATIKELMEKSRKGKGLYNMLSQTRGTAVIINITKFDDEHRSRKGAEFDSQNLDTLFTKMHFDVKLHTCNICNITAKKLKDILQKEAKDDFHKDTDCLVVFILSHGGEGYVLGSDGQKVSIKNDIELPFYATNCKHLEGKPKILFINSCRVKQGDQSNKGLAAYMQDLSLADLKDIFRVYSTVTGFESPRHPKLGCIFVRVIVEVFQAYASTCSLHDLILKVNKIVNDRKYPLLIDTQHSTDKEIYFFPGYDGSDSPESIQTHGDLGQQAESTQVMENDRNRFLLSESGSSQKILIQMETASLLRNRLRDYYQHQLSIVHPVEWNLDVKIAIKDIYVEPQFQDITYQPQTDPSSGNYGAFVQQQSPLLNMQHLLDASKDGPSPRRILLQGPSGIGKTTVLQKIALDWALRTDSPTFKKFAQVFHFPIGTFSGNVPEAIRNNILADDEGILSVKCLMSLFLDTEFQTKTLFLIDGYDDIPENDRTLLSDIWLGKKLRNCTVILVNNTGLPNHLSKATEKRCHLAGLSSENQDNYISKYSQANQISLSKPQSQRIFSQLSHNPLYLSFLCLIMEEHQGNLPTTRVELLQTVVDLVTERAAGKLKTPVDCLRSELDKLYPVAFDSLVKGTMFLPPGAVLLHSRLVALAILVKTKGPSKLRPSTTYRFTHTIFQEYFTAKYLAQLPFEVLESKTAQLNLNQKMTIYVYLTGILAKENNHSLLRNTFKLITQDLKAEGQYLNDEWSFNTEYLGRHNPAHLIPDCLCETGHVQDLRPVIAEVLPKRFAYVNESCGTCFRGILLAANNYELNTELFLNNSLINLELLHCGESFPNISSVTTCIAIHHWDMFSLLLHTFPAITVLYVINILPVIYPVSESYEKLSAILQSKQTVLKSLKMGVLGLGDTGESDLLTVLLQMVGESLLHLHVCNFTLDHASADEIVKVITRCINLKGITFQEITCPEADFAKMMSATMRCHHLMDISFKSVCVTKAGQRTPHGARSDIRPPLPESAYSLLKKEGLRHLIINHQSLSAKLLLFNSSIITRLLLVGIEWPKGIPNSLLKIISNTKLDVLSLCNQNISHSHPRGIEDIVCKVTNIHWLDISGNQIERHPFSTICRHLTNAPNLTKLFLSRCNITDESIFYLSPILGKNKLTVLYLDGNSISLHLITQLVTQGKNLEELTVTVKTSDLHKIEEMKNALTCNHSSMDVLHLLLPCDEGVPLLPESAMRGVSYIIQVHLVTSVYEMLDRTSKYMKEECEWREILYN